MTGDAFRVRHVDLEAIDTDSDTGDSRFAIDLLVEGLAAGDARVAAG